MDDSAAGSARTFGTLGVFASVAAHAAAVWALWHAPRIVPTPRLPARVELHVAAARVEAPPAPPAPADPEPSVPVKRSQPAPAQRAPAERAPQPEPAPAAQEPAVELSGVTLTNDGAGASWSSLTGNGAARSGPIRAAPRAPAASHNEEASHSERLVPLGDLSRRPSPPALDSLLRSYYPDDARRLAIGGVAVVRARIGMQGRVVSARVASETRPGFGAACRKTLLGSRWTPPLDRSGRAVMTDVSYTCRFRVDD